MLWKGFQRPNRLEVEEEKGNYGRFTAQPLERGWGTTIGNALRRVLLSSIEGAAITAVKIEGVEHEFTAVPGVVEDVTDLILNLKSLALRLHEDGPRMLTLDVKAKGAVTADSFEDDAQIEILNPEAPIATLAEGGRLRLEATVSKGRGYSPADRNFDPEAPIGTIPMDSAHSPVRRVNYHVEAARVGQATDYDKLVLEVWTNGTITPRDAVGVAAVLLREHLAIFVNVETDEATVGAGSELPQSELDALLDSNVEEMELSVRSANCLKNAGIHSLRELVQKSEREMLETKNFGRKSLNEIKEILREKGLAFGMNLTAPNGAGR
jgi:DNA-directed RNA polymerase subunit alpha